MQWKIRCPECGRLGSDRLGGYCRACRPPKRYAEERDRSVPLKYAGSDWNDGYAIEEPFFPETFVIEKKKQGLMR